MLCVNILIGNLGGGGAEHVVSELAMNHPADISLSLSLFTSANSQYPSGNVNITDFELLSDINLCSEVLHRISPRLLFRLYVHYYTLHNRKPDVSISFLNLQNCMNIIVSRILDIPVVVSIRNNPSLEQDLWLIHKMQQLLMRISSPYLIVNSEDNRKWIVENYHLDSNRTICIYNPKDIQNIHSLSHEDIPNDFFQTEELVLLTVGRLTQQKGHVHLLRIFSHIQKIIPCRLVICGVGKLEESLKKLADNLRISNSVLFTGWCSNPYKYMKRADVFVFPSLYEGQPNALIEALICGCPIVSTDCDYGPREILDSGKYGILTKKLDGKIDNPITTPLTEAEQDMYNKVLYLMQHPEERERLRQLSSEHILLFDKERCIKKYYDVFRAAAEGKPLTDIE